MNGKACTCSHVADEHGRDPEYPGSTACTAEDCGCLAFEEDVEATEARVTNVLKPTKKGKKTLPERIDEALGGKRATCYELAMRLWPPRTNPRAWGHATKGGPSAWSRTLMAGLHRGGFETNIRDTGPSGTEVLPRRPIMKKKSKKDEEPKRLGLCPECGNTSKKGDHDEGCKRAKKRRGTACNVCGISLSVEPGEKPPECPRCHWVVCETCEAPHAEVCGE